MRKYHTLAQAYSNSESNMSLGEYFSNQGIEYQIGADLASELVKFGFVPGDLDHHDALVKKYTVLIDESELTAIKLSVDGVQIINTSSTNQRLNKVRGWFSWFLDET